MTGDEYEPEKIVAEVSIIYCVECGVEVCHGGFLLRLEFAAWLFVFALEKFVTAKVVHGAMLCGGHEPGAGIVWNAGLGPAFECGDKGILREFFGETNVANDARESGNNFGGLDSPDGVDDAMSGGGFDLRGHGDPFQLVKESAYEKDFTSERGAASSRGQDVRSGPRLKGFASGCRSFVGADSRVLGFRGVLTGLEELAEFAFAVAGDADEFFHVSNGLLFRVGLKDRKAADHFLGLGERAVGDCEIAIGKANTSAGGARHAAFYGKQIAGPHSIVNKIANFADLIWRRRRSSFHA